MKKTLFIVGVIVAVLGATAWSDVHGPPALSPALGRDFPKGG
jgi:hypothetical protein